MEPKRVARKLYLTFVVFLILLGISGTTYNALVVIHDAIVYRSCLEEHFHVSADTGWEKIHAKTLDDKKNEFDPDAYLATVALVDGYVRTNSWGDTDYLLHPWKKIGYGIACFVPACVLIAIRRWLAWVLA